MIDDSQNDVQTTGNSIEARSWADSAGNVYYVDTGALVPQDGLLTSWQIFAKNTRNVELVVYRGEPGSLRVVGRSGVVTPSVGANEFTLEAPFAVLAGDMLGWHTPGTGSVAFDLVEGPWNTGDLRARVLFAWGHPTEFSGSSERVYSIAATTSRLAAEVVITTLEYDGAASSESDEYVEIANRGNIAADISGWRLSSRSIKTDFIFPAGVVLDPGQIIRVFTDLYEPSSGGFAFGVKRPIWRNKGDVATLTDQKGAVVEEFAYGDRSRQRPDEPEITLVLAESVEEVTGPCDDNVVDFVVLQLNDVYDATPVEGGRRGGIARVATLRRELEAENPNLISVMIGDFLAPSVIGSTTGDGGQHMIEALNAMRLDYATIGNHEFDVGHSELVARIGESDFKWVCSNVSDGEGKPFPGVVRNELVEFSNKDGGTARIALLGVCLEMVKKPWIKYKNPIESAREQVSFFKGKADVVLAMTHLKIAEDMELGAAVPRLDVLMGGHEHEAATAIVGDDFTPIFKADSNARSACIHRFRFDLNTGVSKLYTELRDIDEKLENEPVTQAVVEKWQKMTFDTLRAQGSEPTEVVGQAKELLDGREAEVRNRPTNLTQLITETFLAEQEEADAVIYGAGMIRIDGMIPPGDVTFYDIVRIFPINGALSLLDMPGANVRALLDMGEAGKGTGGYVQLANVTREDDTWKIGGEPVVDGRSYKILFQSLPAAYLAYPPFKGTTKILDTRDVRAILADRFRRDAKA